MSNGGVSAKDITDIKVQLAILPRIADDVKEVKIQIRAVNGAVQKNTADIAVLKDWKQERVKEIAKEGDMIRELQMETVRQATRWALIGATGGTSVAGLILGLIFTKAQGWW